MSSTSATAATTVAAPRPAFLAALGSAPALKATTTRVAGGDLKRLLATEPARGADDATRDYFFAGAMDKWMDKIPPRFTFATEFVPLEEADARAIIAYWESTGSRQEITDPSPVVIPAALSGLVARVDAVLRSSFPRGAFVKLTTRSPKDSKTLFRKAEAALAARTAAAAATAAAPTTGAAGGAATTDAAATGASATATAAAAAAAAAVADNARLVAFSEEMVKAAIVHTGEEAVTLLLDSWRAAEDLVYAFEEGKAPAPISVVLRAWDDRMRPQCEWRAFVHDYKLTALGQYWHSLFFPDLADEATVARVVADVQALFASAVAPALPVPTAMLDIARMGPGDAVLIEVNPLMEGLGSFKGSTGLFDYTDDAAVLRGEAPFEVRVRREPEGRASMLGHMSLDWRRVVFGF